MSYNRQVIIVRDGYICATCGRLAKNKDIQIAHKIKQGSGSVQYFRERIRKLYPEEAHKRSESSKWIMDNFINHPFNLTTTCSPYCNDMQNIFHNRVERDALADKIIKQVLAGSFTGRLPED